MNAAARRLAQLEAVEAAKMRARIAAMTDAELEAERDSWPPEERAQLEAMTDAQLEEAAAGRWPGGMYDGSHPL